MLVSNKAQLVRQKFRDYLASERFERGFHEMHPSRTLTSAAVLLTFAMLRSRLAWRALGGARRRGFASARLRRAYEELAEIGVPAVAFAAMHSAGSALRSHSFVPAMLVVSFSTAATEEETRLHAAIAGSTDLMADTPEEEELGRILKDQSFRFRRRRAFPPSMTNGSEVYVFDALITPAHLPRSALETPRIVCIVDTRQNGLIMPLPHDIVQACGFAEPQGESVR